MGGLIKCKYCKRTYNADAYEKHLSFWEHKFKEKLIMKDTEIKREQKKKKMMLNQYGRVKTNNIK